MSLLGPQTVAQTLSLQRRDSSRRRAGIEISLATAHEGARATSRLQRSVMGTHRSSTPGSASSRSRLGMRV
jgi:hypothetical protein